MTGKSVLMVLLGMGVLGATGVSAQTGRWTPGALPWQEESSSVAGPTYVVTQLVPPSPQGAFVNRALLAGAGGFAGMVAGGYGAWALLGGSEGCDLCWQFFAGALVGGVVGGAGATTFADGSFGPALVGSVVGTGVGLLLVGMLDQSADLGGTAMTFSFAVPYTLLTAFFSGR